MLEQDEKPSGVRSTWTGVTPQLATEWLEGNTHNRPISDAVVMRYAADMKAGRWRQTHQGIAFDRGGVLIDGQHRLYAVTESQQTVVMLVTRGLDMDSQHVIDDHRKRNVLDVLKISDTDMIGLTPLHIAAANAMMWGMTPRSSGTSMNSRQAQMEYVKKHWPALQAVTQCFIPALRGVSVAPVVAACARAYYHADLEDIQSFIKVLMTGRTETKRDEPAFVLREWLIRRKAGGRHSGGGANTEMYGKTARALKAFVTDEKNFGRRLYTPSEDPFPIPVAGNGNGKRRAS